MNFNHQIEKASLRRPLLESQCQLHRAEGEDLFAPVHFRAITEKTASLISPDRQVRNKELTAACWCLIIVGILTIIANGFTLAGLPALAHADVKARKMVVLDPVGFEQGVRLLYFINGVALALGIVFVIQGSLVRTYPLAMSVGGLALYALANLGFLMLDPATAFQGALWKGIVVVILAKAIQVARNNKKCAPILQAIRK